MHLMHTVHVFTLPCLFTLAGFPFFLLTTSMWIAYRCPKGSFLLAATLAAVAVDIGGSPGSSSPAPNGADDGGLASPASGRVSCLACIGVALAAGTNDEGRAWGLPCLGAAPALPLAGAGGTDDEGRGRRAWGLVVGTTPGRLARRAVPKLADATIGGATIGSHASSATSSASAASSRGGGGREREGGVEIEAPLLRKGHEKKNKRIHMFSMSRPTVPSKQRRPVPPLASPCTSGWDAVALNSPKVSAARLVAAASAATARAAASALSLAIQEKSRCSHLESAKNIRVLISADFPFIVTLRSQT